MYEYKCNGVSPLRALYERAGRILLIFKPAVLCCPVLGASLPRGALVLFCRARAPASSLQRLNSRLL